MEFICTQCGACCRRAGDWGGAKYGLPIKEDGSCGHLKNNMCSIYDKSPDVCSVKKLGKKLINNITPNKLKNWYIYNSKLCNKMIKEEKLDKKYLIDITKYNINTNKEG